MGAGNRPGRDFGQPKVQDLRVLSLGYEDICGLRKPGDGHLVSKQVPAPEKFLARLIASPAGDLDKFKAISQH